MIAPGDVKATVVDIDRDHKIPERVAVDAQIFYFVYYPNFHVFTYDMRVPPQYESGKYDRYLEILRKIELPPHNIGEAKRKVQICTAGHTIGEFAKTVEYAEIEIRWRGDPSNTQGHFDPRTCKEARYLYAASLPAIRKDVETIIANTRQLIDVLPKPGSEERELTACMDSWKNSIGDYADAVLVSRAAAAGVTNILSDDCDVATMAGITLYTANLSIIRTATTAGKCSNSRARRL